VGRLAERGWERVPAEAALVVPEHFERVLPFTEPAYRRDLRDNLLQAYVAAREADLAVELVRERSGIPGGAQLYLVPSTKLLTTRGLDRLRELAAGGATVYASFFAGSTANQRGPWLAWLDEIFGVRHRLRYGLVEPIEDDEVVFELVEPLGDLEAGARLSFRVGGSESARAYLPVELAGATLVAVDGHGRPALVRRRLGDGCTVLSTYPLEHLAARSARVNPESTWRLYSALALEAGVSRPVRVDDPRVLVGRVRSGGRETALFVNASADEVSVEPLLEDGVELDLGGGPLALGPYAVADAPVSGGEPRRPEPATAVAEGRDAGV
jgi:hypothetical protein